MPWNTGTLCSKDEYNKEACRNAHKGQWMEYLG